MSTEREQTIDPERLADVLDQVSRWGGRGRAVNPEVCGELRRRRRAGQTYEKACTDLPLNPESSSYHSTGACACDTDVSPVNERSGRVDSRSCYELRARWRLGESITAIAEDVRWQRKTVACHVLGWQRCSHRSEGRG